MVHVTSKENVVKGRGKFKRRTESRATVQWNKYI